MLSKQFNFNFKYIQNSFKIVNNAYATKVSMPECDFKPNKYTVSIIIY